MTMAGEIPRHRRRTPLSREYSPTEDVGNTNQEASGKETYKHGHFRGHRSRCTLAPCNKSRGRRTSAIWGLLVLCGVLATVSFLIAGDQLAFMTPATVSPSAEEGYYRFNVHRYLTSAPSPTPFNSKPFMVQIQSDFTVETLPLPWEMNRIASRHVEFEQPRMSRHKSRSELRDGCEPMAEWQTTFHLGCNAFHEVELAQMQDEVDLVNNGAYRDVWMIREYNGTRRALKTLRYIKKREFDHRNFERHRRDALAYEALSASHHVAHIYGYCANSAFFDYCDGGDLADLMYQNQTLSEEDRLKIAHSVAAGVADAHHVDEKGRATIAHTDIKANQFILLDGEYKLSDFNRARLLSWNTEDDETCGFTVGKNAGSWRSPEEYGYKYETEKVDVWSLGLVLNLILTGEYPYQDMEDSDNVPEFVIHGGRVNVTNTDILSSNHPFHKAMVLAIDRCLVYDAKKRASAREIANLLSDALVSLS